ncbi:MAG: hypothetical protein N2Z76_03690 [Treponemataceae bacterium]|nr:hypothetical protein [Treponemataceae bacterium]
MKYPRNYTIPCGSVKEPIKKACSPKSPFPTTDLYPGLWVWGASLGQAYQQRKEKKWVSAPGIYTKWSAPRKKGTAFLGSLLVVLLMTGPLDSLYTQGNSIVIDESTLFGESGDEPNTETGIEKVQDTANTGVQFFLKSERPRVGGSFSPTLTANWTWKNLWDGSSKLGEPETAVVTPDLSARIFFDGRPQEDLRMYGSFKIGWPFEHSQQVLTSATYQASPGPTVFTSSTMITTPNVRIFELFTDFSYQDRLFFRFGKHTVKWGVGYFFSPADIINLTPIDLLDPTAQREGPVSFRLHIPIPQTSNNLWLYTLIPSEIATDTLQPQDLAVAAKYEQVLGAWEVGLGGYYQKDRSPRLMMTATGSVGKVALFGELVGSWGSDKKFVTAITQNPTAPFTTTTYKDRMFLSGTAGFMYIHSGENLTIIGQYYYNGEGYAPSERKKLLEEAESLLAVLGNTASSVYLAPLLYQSGQHYGAFSFSKQDVGIKDVTISILILANLSDLSGFVVPSLSYKLMNYITLSVQPTFYWCTEYLWGSGKKGEYVVLPGGPAITLRIKAGLGGGQF